MSVPAKKKVNHLTFEWVVRDIYLCEKLFHSHIEGPNFQTMDPSFAWSLELGQSEKSTTKGISLYVKRNGASKEVSVNMRVTVHKGKEANAKVLLDEHFKETFKPAMLWESPILVSNKDFKMEFIESTVLCKSWKILVELMYFEVVADDSARIPLVLLDKKTIGDDLIKLYKSGQLVDNELKCVDGSTFDVHNAIIFARCPYFTQKLSEYEGAPPKKRKISFDFDPSSEEMKCLLYYIYAGSIDSIDTLDPLPLRISECAAAAKLGDLKDTTESQSCKSEGYLKCEPFTFDWNIGYLFRDPVQELKDLEKEENEHLTKEAKASKFRKTKIVSEQELGLRVKKNETYSDLKGDNAYFFGFQAMKGNSEDSDEDNSLKNKPSFVTNKYEQEPFPELKDEYFESFMREQLEKNEASEELEKPGTSKPKNGNQESEQFDKYTKPFESSIYRDFGVKEEFQLVLKVDSLNGSLYISPYLKLIKGEKIYVFIKFSIKHNMKKVLRSKKLVEYLKPGECVGIPNFFSFEELQKRNTFKDILTLLCDIKYSVGTVSVKNHIHAVYTTSDTFTADNEVDEEYLEQFQPKYFRYNLMSDNLKALLESKEFSDCTIVVEDGSFQAHKAILAARSPYFLDLFLNRQIRGKSTIVFTDNWKVAIGYTEMGEIIKRENKLAINSSQMEIILQEIYTGSATIEESMQDNMKPLAEFFGLPSLKRKCSELITLSPESMPLEERLLKSRFASKDLLELIYANGDMSSTNTAFELNGSTNLDKV